MEPSYYEFLALQDNDFLLWESPALPMHVSAVQIFDAGPLAREDGGIDFAAIKQLYASILHNVPRYRQKIAWVPGQAQAVWTDDAQFNIDYHMRHIGLPRPGDDDQLKRIAADIMERPLDRSRPLWETWVIEGLASNRFAIVTKTHHCMVDGASGMSLLKQLLSLSANAEIREAPRYVPRPAPRPALLRRAARRRRITRPARLVRNVAAFVTEHDDLVGEVAQRLRSLGALARMKTTPVSETPINGANGPHRIFDWLHLPLDDLKAVRRARGCSINDVVLASVTGAVRKLMLGRQLAPEKLEFRVAIPVNTRASDREIRPGNQVSSWIVRLPLEHSDPLEQLACIRATTQALKDGHQADGIEFIKAVQEWLPLDLQAASIGTQNMLVTNVPGPPFPMYLLGAELLYLFAQAPLIQNVGLAVSVVSYNGNVGWGFNADYDLLPDLRSFTRGVTESFERLAKAAASASPYDTGDAADS